MDVITFLVLSLTPGVEPRYAVAAAVLSGWNPLLAVSFGVAAVLALSGVLVTVLSAADRVLLRVPLLRDAWRKYRERVREKAGRYVDRWGALGLALFVAVPAPGTGLYTGALAAYLLNMDLGKAWRALVAGGIASNVLTLMFALSGSALLVAI